MAIFKCKMCGGELTVEEGASVAVCEYCGSKQTVPKADDEKKMKLFDRANRLRFNCEFDKAGEVYENIIEEFPEEAEAYWGNLLCKFGIEYIDDPVTGDKVPTCHRSSFDSLMDDYDFDMVMENSDTLSRAVYREQAKQIEGIRKGIIEVSGKEEPYDIFICYKETAQDGQRTIDSVIAQDVYDALITKGYRVFFSRISLEDKLGTEYEPYIFAALNSAKVMLAFGTSYDYYNAVWVKNEWSRFLKLMAKDKTKALIPCYKDIDAYDMPKEFAKLQAQDMGKVGAIQDLLRGVDKITGHNQESTASSQSTAQSQTIIQQIAAGGPNITALLDRGNMALEDGKFDDAQSFFNQVLNMDAKCGNAYLGIAMAAASATSLSVFGEMIANGLETDSNYERAKKYSMAECVSLLDSFEKRNEERLNGIAEKEMQEAEAAREKYSRIEKIIKRTEEAAKEEIAQVVFLEQEIAQKWNELAGLGLFDRKKHEIKKQISLLETQLEKSKHIICKERTRIVADLYPTEFYERYFLSSFTGDIVEFGKYESGHGIEPILWKVIDDKKGRLLITEKAIEGRPYNEKKRQAVTWETCTLRNWLNQDFYLTAFNDEEKKWISKRTIAVEKSSESESNPGNETVDCVFLLNVQEIKEYFPSAIARKCVPTELAIQQGAYTSLFGQAVGGKATCWWWLRAPTDNLHCVYEVGSEGDIRESTVRPDSENMVCVRPALWIDLKGLD